MKRLFKILGLFCALVVICAIIYVVVERLSWYRPFDSQKWKIADFSVEGDPRLRWKMLKSLIKKHKIIGLSRDEVLDLLGDGGKPRFTDEQIATRIDELRQWGASRERLERHSDYMIMLQDEDTWRFYLGPGTGPFGLLDNAILYIRFENDFVVDHEVVVH